MDAVLAQSSSDLSISDEELTKLGETIKKLTAEEKEADELVQSLQLQLVNAKEEAKSVKQHLTDAKVLHSKSFNVIIRE